MVANSIKRFATQVQRHKCNISTPHGMVIAAIDIRRQRVFAGMTTWAVPAVVAECDGLGEGDIETDGASNRRGNLGHLERVGQAGALVVLRKHEDLGLAGESPKRRRVQDTITIALETGAVGVGFLFVGAVSGAKRAGGERCKMFVLAGFAGVAGQHVETASASPRICVSKTNASVVGVAVHG